MVVPARRDACKRGFSCPRLGLPVAVAAFSVACCARTWACASSLSRCALARLPATCLRRLRVVLPISFGVGVFFGSFSFMRSEEHTSELQSHSDLVCRLL